MHRYIGSTLEIIYQDRNDKLTQRSIYVCDIKDDIVRATCLQSGGLRTFRVQNILAWQPAMKRYA